MNWMTPGDNAHFVLLCPYIMSITSLQHTTRLTVVLSGLLSRSDAPRKVDNRKKQTHHVFFKPIAYILYFCITVTMFVYYQCS